MARAARPIFAAGVTTYGLGLLGWLFWPAFGESAIGKVVGIPLFSIYIFEHLGVPGLTDHANCDWMWCRATIFGIAFTTAVWLGAAWLVSIGIARLSRSPRTRAGGR